MSTYVKDLSLRVFCVFAFAFLSVFSFTDLTHTREALVAGAAAVAEVIRGLVAKYIGDPDSAGFHS